MADVISTVPSTWIMWIEKIEMSAPISRTSAAFCMSIFVYVVEFLAVLTDVIKWQLDLISQTSVSLEPLIKVKHVVVTAFHANEDDALCLRLRFVFAVLYIRAPVV